MSSLWESNTPQVWASYSASARKIIPAIESAVPRAGNGKLTELHTWFTTSLAESVSSRSPASLTAAELERVMEYKLTRGAFRATLMALIKSNSPASVESASAKSFAAAEALFKSHPPSGPAPSSAQIKAVLEPICTLRGVGPATASLVLSLPFYGFPFASDEALVSALEVPKGGKLAYSHPEYGRFFTALWEKRQALERAPADSSSSSLSLSAMAEALWVAACAKKHGVDLSGSPNEKQQEAKAEKGGRKRAASVEADEKTATKKAARG